MYEIYKSLGSLMMDSIRHHLEYRPKEAIALLRAKELAKTVLKRAKAAQEQLFFTAEPKDRYFLWSDLKWQTGLYPPEEPKVSAKAQKEARQWLNMMGGTPKLVDLALKEANLGYNWDPEAPITWEQEEEERNQEKLLGAQ